MKLKFIFGLIIILSTSIAHLQSQILFTKNYAATGQLLSLESSQNGYLLGGAISMAVDFSGNELLRIQEISSRLRADSYNSELLLAQTYYPVSSGKVSASIANYDNLGNLIWSKSLNGGHWGNYSKDLIALDDSTMFQLGRYHSVTGTGATLRKFDHDTTTYAHIFNQGNLSATFGEQLFINNGKLYSMGRANAGTRENSVTRDCYIALHRQADGIIQKSFLVNDDSIQDIEDLLFVGDSILMLINTNQDISRSGLRGSLQWLKEDSAAFIFQSEWLYPSDDVEHFKAVEKVADSAYLVLGNRFSGTSDSIFTFLRTMDLTGSTTWNYEFANATQQLKGKEMINEGNGNYTIAGNTITAGGTREYFLTQVNLHGLINGTAASLNNVSQEAFRAYPNPAHDNVTIDIAEESDAVDIKIVDIKGQIVIEQSPGSYPHSINLSGLASGIYLLSIKGLAAEHFTKLMVE